MVNVSNKLIPWIFILLRSIYCQRFVDDICTISSTGASGRCQLLANCPSAIQGLQSNIFPQTCGFQGSQPIVCCVGGSQEPVTTKPIVTQRPTTRSTPSRVTPTTQTVTKRPVSVGPQRVGDKSKQKCLEYGAYVFAESGVSLGVGPAGREDTCEIQSITLIVGGKKAVPREFPHMALIGFEGESKEKKWQCGGSLISEQFILTASHCLYDQQYGDPKYIRIGDLELNNDRDEASPQEFNVLEKIRHPSYRPPSQYHDIALLKMDRRAELNQYARPACLHTERNINTNLVAASGWGKVGFTSDTSQALLKVTLETFTFPECSNAYRNNIGIRLRNGIVDDTQLCAGSHNASKDTCQGDSGGPLQIVKDEKEVHCMYSIIGVTSFGKACGVATIPGVYTRVSNYVEWIESIVWP